MIDRRGFLSSFAALRAPVRSDCRQVEPLLEQEPPKLPDSTLYSSNEEAYWKKCASNF